MSKGFTASDGFVVKFCKQEFGDFHRNYLNFEFGCTSPERRIVGVI